MTAFEWFSACVLAIVAGQLVRPGETPLASNPRTFVRLLACNKKTNTQLSPCTHIILILNLTHVLNSDFSVNIRCKTISGPVYRGGLGTVVIRERGVSSGRDGSLRQPGLLMAAPPGERVTGEPTAAPIKPRTLRERHKLDVAECCGYKPTSQLNRYTLSCFNTKTFKVP